VTKKRHFGIHFGAHPLQKNINFYRWSLELFRASALSETSSAGRVPEGIYVSPSESPRLSRVPEFAIPPSKAATSLRRCSTRPGRYLQQNMSKTKGGLRQRKGHTTPPKQASSSHTTDSEHTVNGDNVSGTGRQEEVVWGKTPGGEGVSRSIS
jgi:hypothetical protein